MSDLNATLAECNTKMNKAIDVAKEDFATIRTGRAHPAMFAKLMVDYYGTGTPLSQLATVQVPEARLALITPYDKGAMAAIEKAIAAQPDVAEKVRGGHVPAAGALIGAVMKETKGQADAAKVRELLLKHLGQA